MLLLTMMVMMAMWVVVFQFCCVLLALLAGIELLSAQGNEEDEGKTVADVIYVSGAIKVVTYVSWWMEKGVGGGVWEKDMKKMAIEM